jgi:hypothetical protein
MSSLALLKAPVILPDFGAARIECEWRKSEGFRVGIVYDTTNGYSTWHSYKTYAKLSTALNAAGRIAKRCERAR